MVGLGCGARSYTSALHYSHDYAVGLRGVRAVVQAYLDADELSCARVGYHLDPDEQRRRWLLKSLLRADGVDVAAYARRFAVPPRDDFPQLDELIVRGWLAPPGTGEVAGDAAPARLRLTAEGLARSDAIGPWLVSPAVRRAMSGFDLR